MIFVDRFVARSGGLAMPEKKQCESLTKVDATHLLASSIDGEFFAMLSVVLKTYRSPGWLTVGQVANMAGTSVRTVQRRLAAEGSNFSDLVGKARGELAFELLENTDDSMTEIALDLGYSTQANFSRAFKRRTGISPSEYRKSRS